MTRELHCLQVRESAANAGVVLAGENALPVFSPSGVDSVALERIVYNTKVTALAIALIHVWMSNRPCA